MCRPVARKGTGRGLSLCHFLQGDFENFLQQHPELPVINHGPVKGDKKFSILNEADIFVFPTYYRNEGHPWVTVEAMAAGLPVISTDHAAISESVHDGKNGYLVEKKNLIIYIIL